MLLTIIKVSDILGLAFALKPLLYQKAGIQEFQEVRHLNLFIFWQIPNQILIFEKNLLALTADCMPLIMFDQA